MTLSLQMNYLDLQSRHLFTGKFIFDINATRIDKDANGNRQFNYQHDGQDYSLIDMRFTYPNSNEAVPQFALVAYQRQNNQNIVADVIGEKMQARIAAYCAELDRADWLRSIEKLANTEMPC